MNAEDDLGRKPIFIRCSANLGNGPWLRLPDTIIPMQCQTSDGYPRRSSQATTPRYSKYTKNDHVLLNRHDLCIFELELRWYLAPVYISALLARPCKRASGTTSSTVQSPSLRRS